MPLGEPPSASQLARLSQRRLAGTPLHRIVRTDRATPWWFASLPAASSETVSDEHGRYDLPAPWGTCYLGTTVAGALIAALQDLGPALIPDTELVARRRVTVAAPTDAPASAWLTTQKARAIGVTAALWAGSNRVGDPQVIRALAKFGTP